MSHWTDLVSGQCIHVLVVEGSIGGSSHGLGIYWLARFGAGEQFPQSTSSPTVWWFFVAGLGADYY